ncbi:GreA/GreB family elongation factor [Pseudorhizobium flavum]|uniref:GreA/GreB family elongation factor n=1 Tax=Pseudorhizobium flavum TaxID=1335061 RepID=UPI0037704FB4
MSDEGSVVSAELKEKLENTWVVSGEQLPADAVRIGSVVDYSIDKGTRQRLRLVYPDDICAETGRISVLSPIGTALLGLRSGQAAEWFSANGERCCVSIIGVSQHGC